MKAGKQAGLHQLILPGILTLQDWVWQQAPPSQPVLSETSKQCLLVEALRRNPALFQTNNTWPLAKELVSLFSECTQAQVPLQDGEQQLQAILQKSYQYPNINISNISRESEIVFRLWQAYREQIHAGGWIDSVEYYCQWLMNNAHQYKQQQFLVIGRQRINTAEAIFFEQLAKTNNLLIYIPKVSPHQYGTYHHPCLRYIKEASPTTVASNSREQALDIIYDRRVPARTRIDQLKAAFPENIFNNWLSIYKCHSIEKHVKAVSIQAKKWLIEGLHPIAIVVSDRLLARRIRAVLEQQGIQPTDLGGWTLSTTSAATSIEILLDAVEYNFRKDTLLDLLSSPFLQQNNTVTEHESNAYIKQVFQLTKFLKNHRNTDSDNLDSLHQLAISYFVSQSIEHSEINAMFKQLNTSCHWLKTSGISGEFEITKFAGNLIKTLKALGMYHTLYDDIAGEQLLGTLEAQLHESEQSTIKINWKEWRQWLRDLFEHNYFIPSGTDKRITLCGFEHIDDISFKAAIIAGVEENRMTNTTSQRTFFNEKVRHELHLPTSHENNAINFVRFRQLLQQCNKVLLSAEIDNRGEPQEICSWVKLLNIFSQQCYQNELDNLELDKLVQDYETYHQQNNTISNDKTARPHVISPAELIPARISATQYQSLVNCPYQYFAKYILGLSEQEVSDDFEASEYGSLVHECLYQFHFSDTDKTRRAFNHEQYDQLIKELTDLSTGIFMSSPYPTIVKQGWCQRWITNIPAYIDWAIERAREWRTLHGEFSTHSTLNENFTLHGQLDRVDSDNRHLAVVDYKTGSSVPSKKNILSGESVQLPFYALLDDKISQAEFLELGKQNEVKSSALLNTEQLSELKTKHRSRLESLFNALLKGTQLTAHGEDNICRICSYGGLCRKQHWFQSSE